MAERLKVKLVAEGVNLAAFNTPESAADIEDLRRALGYERVNLYGISYGTRLALAAMRDHLECFRALRADLLDEEGPRGAWETAGPFAGLDLEVFASW